MSLTLQAIDVCYTVTGVDDCYTAKETLRDIINDQDSGLAFQLRESCLGIQCAHLIENNYQWACPKKSELPLSRSKTLLHLSPQACGLNCFIPCLFLQVDIENDSAPDFGSPDCHDTSIL